MSKKQTQTATSRASHCYVAPSRDEFDELLVWLKKCTKQMRILYSLPDHGAKYGEVLRAQEHAYRNVMKKIASICRAKKQK